jgi:hypothetical protein
MRPDGTLEEWDEALLPGYRHRAVSLNPKTGRPYRQRRDRGARIDDLFIMMHEAMRAYQGYFVKTGPFQGLFQFARYLEDGDEITNETTGEIYTIKELLYEENNLFLGEVILNGNTDPEETDRLRLDVRNQVVFSRADSRSEASSYEPNSEGERTDEQGPLRDTIEYGIRRSEPGSVGPKPFGGDRQAMPAIRESNLDDLIDPGVAVDVYGQWFDHIIQFDCFARNNERLYGTRKVSGEGTLGLVAWFQDFMARNRWIFTFNGIQRLLEWQDTRDQPVGRLRTDMLHRPLLWYARTERVSSARTRRIESIDLVFNVAAPEGLTAQSACPEPTGQISLSVNDLGLYRPLLGDS